MKGVVRRHLHSAVVIAEHCKTKPLSRVTNATSLNAVNPHPLPLTFPALTLSPPNTLAFAIRGSLGRLLRACRRVASYNSL